MTDAPVAVAAPALDLAAARLVPPTVVHEKFSFRSWPTWVTTSSPLPDEGPGGWYAALAGSTATSRFLVRLVPFKGRLPGDGWRNMLAWALRTHAGVRLVPLNSLPSDRALGASPAWEYRIEAGQGPDAAAWDVQFLPSRQLLGEFAPGISDPWEATALVRWIRPGAPEPADLPVEPSGAPRWADFLGRLPAADARLLVQNFFSTQSGGAQSSAGLFFETRLLSPGADGRTLVRHVPVDGLPVSLLSTLFGRRAWNEIDRAKRFLPSEGDLRDLRAEALAGLDRMLADGRLKLSDAALDLWQAFYRVPRHRLLTARLAHYREPARWDGFFSGDPMVLETLLRRLDVTDAALCLRDAPDTRWRRFVTGRRETEIKEEFDFCQAWDSRGELTVERQLEAWESWDELLTTLVHAHDGPAK